MAGDGADDFNRLYERLVTRRATPKKRGKRPAAQPQQVYQETKDADALLEISEAARLEDARRKAQREHDMCIYTAVKRLCLARNLRGFARLSRWSPRRLAFQLVACDEEDERRFLKRYQKIKLQHSRKYVRRREGRSLELVRNIRLEGVAARLFFSRAADFGPGTATALEGRHRVVDELLFFSPPMFMSHIGYAESGNVVPTPPSRRLAFYASEREGG